MGLLYRNDAVSVHVPRPDLCDGARADRAENEELDVLSDDAFLAGAALEDAAKMRGRYRRLYVQLEKTKEWVENNYYRLPMETQNADLVRVNAFWNDFAQHQGDGQFFSRHWAEASNNFTEIMLALAVSTSKTANMT